MTWEDEDGNKAVGETMPVPFMLPWAKTFDHAALAAYEVTRHQTGMMATRVVGDDKSSGKTQYVVQRKTDLPGRLGEWQTLTEDDEWAFFVHLGLDLPDDL